MKGDYLGRRLAAMLDEIKCEAMVARLSDRRLERDRAFEEIKRLAVQSAELLERLMLATEAAA